MVFIATVLPPVLGPVMTSPRKPGPILIVTGTAFFPSNGCLASIRFTTLSDPAGIVLIRRAFIDVPYRARAVIKSMVAVASKAERASSFRFPINRDIRRSIRSSSR